MLLLKILYLPSICAKVAKPPFLAQILAYNNRRKVAKATFLLPSRQRHALQREGKVLA